MVIICFVHCRDNVLFGRHMDADRYEQIIHACALAEDVAALPKGHETFVGSRGVMLSGGQQARLSLARAMYQVRHPARANSCCGS